MSKKVFDRKKNFVEKNFDKKEFEEIINFDEKKNFDEKNEFPGARSKSNSSEKNAQWMWLGTTPKFTESGFQLMQQQIQVIVNNQDSNTLHKEVSTGTLWCISIDKTLYSKAIPSFLPRK